MDSAQAAGTMQLEIRELSLDINWNKRLFLFPTASAASLCMSAPLHTRLLEHQPTPHFILHHIKIPTHFLCWCDASFIIIFYSSVLMVIMIMSCHAHVLQFRRKKYVMFLQPKDHRCGTRQDHRTNRHYQYCIATITQLYHSPYYEQKEKRVIQHVSPS